MGHAAGYDDRPARPVHARCLRCQIRVWAPPPTAPIARLRVDGGSPYLDATGAPQYPPDTHDSSRTHPSCKRAAPDRDYLTNESFGMYDDSAVTYDMRRLAPLLKQEILAALADSPDRRPPRQTDRLQLQLSALQRWLR